MTTITIAGLTTNSLVTSVHQLVLGCHCTGLSKILSLTHQDKATACPWAVVFCMVGYGRCDVHCSILFHFIQTTYHGFPNGPTALAFDKDSQLLVIGTKFGELRVFGRPGVEFSVVSDTGSPITALFTVSGLHQLISVSADNKIVTWELATEGKPTLSAIKEFVLDPEG